MKIGVRLRAVCSALATLTFTGLIGCATATKEKSSHRAASMACWAYTPRSPLPGAVHASFRLPRAEPVPFFDLPWPTDLLRISDRRLDFRSFPGQGALLISDYIDTAARDVDGYSVAPAIYFHFDGPIAEARLPSGVKTTPSARDAVFLVDVDPASPERGTFIPLARRYYQSAYRHVPAHTIAIKPLPGFVLRGDTLYAAVVRRDLGDASGAPLGTTPDLEAIKWTEPRPDAAEERARALHARAFDRLTALGAGRADIAAIALFRTQAPHAVTERLLDTITRLTQPAHARAPRVASAEWYEERSFPHGPGAYWTVRGVYCTPNFQTDIDKAPFLSDGGGTFALDERGAPRVIDIPEDSKYHDPTCGGLLRARFVLTIPTSPMPPGGYPLIVSSHGTGGSAYTFLGPNDFAGWAAREGIAVVSTDQPLHGGGDPLGGRPGSREPVQLSIAGFPININAGDSAAELSFYNFIHPAAARDNLRQAAADGMVLARLFATFDFKTLLPRREGRDRPRFDPSKVMVAGHSQGSQSAIAQGALDPLVRGVLLSGCGGDARLGILGRRDLAGAVMPIIATMLELSPGELDEFHPFMSLLQTLADPIDPQSYARLYWDPLPGRRPQNVLHYAGLWDSYTPPETAEALAVALRATPLDPPFSPIVGLGRPEGPLESLLAKTATRAFAQFEPTMGEDGHFVIYHEPGAINIARRFMKGVVRAGTTY